MNKNYTLLGLLCLFMALSPVKFSAQCTSPNAYGTIVINNQLPTYVNFYSCTYAEEYNTINANFAGVYSFSVDNGGASPIYLTLKDASSNNVVFGSSPLTTTITTLGTYYLHISETGPPNCLTNQNCHETYVQVIGLPGSPTVITQPDSVMVCQGNPAQFNCSATPNNITSYQWQEDAGLGFVNLTNGGIYSGVTTPSLTISAASTTMNYYVYRCVITNSVSPNYTDPAMLTVISSSVLPFYESFDPVQNLPSTWVNGLNGWYVYMNHGTNGSNGMTRNLYGSSNILAEVYSPQIGPITPSTSISFDYRIVDYSNYPSTATSTLDIVNDSLNIYVSNNCGVTFTLLGSINAANHTSSLTFTNMSYSLNAYAGNNLTFKFKGVKDPSTGSDYYFDVDNINLFNITAIDAGVSAILSPSASGCYSTSTPVVVTITNFGTGPLSNVPVTVTTGGAVSQTITGTYTGTIAVGSSVTFTVGNINMGIGSGVYNFTATTQLANDGNLLNDMSMTTFTPSPMISIMGPAMICTGNSATLTVNGTATTYTWSTGPGTTSIVVSPTMATTYSVTGTTTMGCMASAIVTLSVQDPTITAIGDMGCGSPASGTLAVNAFTPSVVNWYASPSSTLSLATGNTFSVTAPSTTTYYAVAASTAMDSLFTTLAAGNGYAGNMFDVTALANLTINRVDMHFDSPGTTTVEVWYRPGTFVGFETSNAGWTLAHTTTISTLGSGVLSPVPGTFSISVPAGQTYGLYVTTLNGNPQTNYTNGTAVGNLYASNGDLQLFEGNGGDYFYVNNSPRIFNGQLHYEKEGCTSPRIPVVFTVTTAVSVNATASSSMICAGQSVTLSATGAGNYTWTPGGATTSSIVVTPTSSVTYSVVGAVNSCSASSSTALIVNICTGIEAAELAATISIYPNPSQGNVFVSMPQAPHGNYVFELSDVSGRTVYQAMLTGEQTSLNIRDLANGLYSYTIKNPTGKDLIKSGKLLKQ